MVRVLRQLSSRYTLTVAAVKHGRILSTPQRLWVHVMFVGKERLFHLLLSQSLIVRRLVSPRPRPQEPALSKVEGPSGEVCFQSRFLHFGPLIVGLRSK